jgi:hypothetical protein
MQVYNNFLPESYASDIENLLLSPNFPWYIELATVGDYNEQKGFRVDTSKSKESSFFAHGFLKEGQINSAWFEYFNHIVLNIQNHIDGYKDTILHRFKANLYTLDSGYSIDNYHTPHLDGPEGYLTAIYYVNDSDGDTMFFDDHMNIIHRQEPKKNTLIVFPSNIFHASSPPRETKFRSNINIVFKGVK